MGCIVKKYTTIIGLEWKTPGDFSNPTMQTYEVDISGSERNASTTLNQLVGIAIAGFATDSLGLRQILKIFVIS